MGIVSRCWHLLRRRLVGEHHLVWRGSLRIHELVSWHLQHRAITYWHGIYISLFWQHSSKLVSDLNHFALDYRLLPWWALTLTLARRDPLSLLRLTYIWLRLLLALELILDHQILRSEVWRLWVKLTLTCLILFSNRNLWGSVCCNLLTRRYLLGVWRVLHLLLELLLVLEEQLRVVLVCHHLGLVLLLLGSTTHYLVALNERLVTISLLGWRLLLLYQW